MRSGGEAAPRQVDRVEEPAYHGGREGKDDDQFDRRASGEIAPHREDAEP